jgi:hypothetical protein
VTLYLCLIEQYFDTAQRQAYLEKKGILTQEKFPEKAVKKIPAADIVGNITFVRVFHGTTDDLGFTLFFHKGLSSAPSPDVIRDRFVKEQRNLNQIHRLKAQANTLFNAAKRLHLKAIKWTGGGAKDVSVTLKGVAAGVTAATDFVSYDRVERTNGSPTVWQELWTRAQGP